MRYYLEHGNENLVNGKSHLRVRTIGHFTRPRSPGRIIKVFAVVHPVRGSKTNPIQTGALLALSFPEMEVNKRDYTWKRGEETQVKVNVQLHKRKGMLLSDPATPVDSPIIQP